MASVRKQSPPRKKTAKKKSSKRVSKKSSSSISLPEAEGDVGESIDDFNICIFGRKNIGKSTLGAAFPNSLTFMFERGRFLPIKQVPKKGEPKLTWETFREYRDLLVAGDHEFTRITLDTIDEAYEACFDWVCEEGGFSHPAKAPDSVEAWRSIKKEFADVIWDIYEAGIGITFVSHEKAKPLVTKFKGLNREDEEVSQVKISRLEPSCKGQPWEVMQQLASYVFYYGFIEGVRCLTVRSPLDIHWTACERQDTFCDPDGTPILSFRAGTSPKETYEVLQKGFANQLRDVDYIPPAKPRKKFKRKKR